jgi:hypothetical protein
MLFMLVAEVNVLFAEVVSRLVVGTVHTKLWMKNWMTKYWQSNLALKDPCTYINISIFEYIYIMLIYVNIYKYKHISMYINKYLKTLCQYMLIYINLLLIYVNIYIYLQTYINMYIYIY